MTSSAATISVLIVDDSAFMRKMVSEMVAEDPGLCVAGIARDGEDALRQLEVLRPDVITLDVEMPRMDGLTALGEIMRRRPTPVVMLSSLTQAGADMTLRCLEQGAVDFVGKPSGAISLDIRRVAADLTAKIKAAAGAKRLAQGGTLAGTCGGAAASPKAAPTMPSRLSTATPMGLGRALSLLVIGASTGGPRALQSLVPALPGDLRAPVVIVQHMPPTFTASLARRLDEESGLHVREAVEGDTLRPGVALVAPGGRHLEFDAHGVARLTDAPPVHGVRPSVDVTLASLAKLHGPRMLAVLLTGMGRDGARGLKTIRTLGGHTLAEDESTCVVYGMPKAAVDLDAVERLLPLHEIPAALRQIFGDTSAS